MKQPIDNKKIKKKTNSTKKDSKESKQLNDTKKTKPKSEAYKKYQKYIRSKEWEKKKEIIYNFYSKKCYCCGRTNTTDENNDIGLSIHHNSYQYLYDEENHIDCVIPLCKVCHLCLHRNKNNFNQFKFPE